MSLIIRLSCYLNTTDLLLTLLQRNMKLCQLLILGLHCLALGLAGFGLTAQCSCHAINR
eukprot:XP_001704209.1 Hypothetical protein GL50803_35719 [Giardia lamblia ATCC 50803]